MEHSREYQNKQAIFVVNTTPASHDIISEEPAHSAILDLTWRRRREHVLSFERYAVNEILQFNFSRLKTR